MKLQIFLVIYAMEMKFHNDVYCSSAQSVGARQNVASSTPWGIPLQVHMKDSEFAPSLWIKDALVPLGGLTGIL